MLFAQKLLRTHAIVSARRASGMSPTLAKGGRDPSIGLALTSDSTRLKYDAADGEVGTADADSVNADSLRLSFASQFSVVFALSFVPRVETEEVSEGFDAVSPVSSERGVPGSTIAAGFSKLSRVAWGK